MLIIINRTLRYCKLGCYCGWWCEIYISKTVCWRTKTEFLESWLTCNQSFCLPGCPCLSSSFRSYILSPLLLHACQPRAWICVVNCLWTRVTIWSEKCKWQAASSNIPRSRFLLLLWMDVLLATGGNWGRRKCRIRFPISFATFQVFFLRFRGILVKITSFIQVDVIVAGGGKILSLSSLSSSSV